MEHQQLLLSSISDLENPLKACVTLAMKIFPLFNQWEGAGEEGEDQGANLEEKEKFPHQMDEENLKVLYQIQMKK